MLLGTIARGQFLYSHLSGFENTKFHVDYSQFRGEGEDLSRLEVYYKIFNADLLFVKETDLFRAAYDIHISVFNKKGRIVASEVIEKETTVREYARTQAPNDFRIGQVNFNLPGEKYKVECRLIDKNSGDQTSRDFKVELDNFDSRRPQLSGIQFLLTVDSTLIDSAFVKNGYSYIPDVHRYYGGDTSATVKIYYEIYKSRSDKDEIPVVLQVIDRKKNWVYRDSVDVTFDSGGIIRRYEEIPLRGFKSGEYTIESIVVGRRGRGLDKANGSFMVYWTPEAMVLNDFESATQQMSYIATSDEMNRFKDLVSPAEQLQAWKEFWLVRDPTPGTRPNEYKDEYYMRVRYADRVFSVMRKEGWRTDRGMIYILYGEPNQIEDHPFEMGYKPYQVWYYYNVANQVREFLFVDNYGNNDYVLQYPYDGIHH